jgi:signal transduction histidine kinase
VSLVAGATRISIGLRVGLQVAMFVVIAGLVAQSRRSRRRGNRVLGEQEALNARLQNLVLEADDETRRSVAELLHGPVQGRLLAAEMGLIEIRDQAVLSVPARDQLGDVLDMLRSLRDDDVRKLSHVLHPSALDIGLIAAFRSLIAQMSQTYSVDISLRIDPVIEAIDVLVELDHDVVRVRVRDDGTGLVGRGDQPTSVGLGLTAIAVRAGARGGRVTLERTGQLTELCAEVRVRRADLGRDHLVNEPPHESGGSIDDRRSCPA